jgi:WD40 repeat protein
MSRYCKNLKGLMSVHRFLVLAIMALVACGPLHGFDSQPAEHREDVSVHQTSEILYAQLCESCYYRYVKAIALSPYGEYLAVASDDGLTLYAMGSFEEVWSVTTQSPLLSVAFSPDGSMISTGDGDHTLTLWDATTGEAISTLSGHLREITAIAWSNDGRMLASGGEAAIIWDIGTLSQIHRFETPGDTWGLLSSLAWSPDDKLLAVADIAGQLVVWNVETGSPLYVINAFTRDTAGDAQGVTNVAWSPDGSELGTGSHVGMAAIWASDSGEQLQARELSDRLPDVWVNWTPDGTPLASTLRGNEDVAFLSNIETGEILYQSPRSIGENVQTLCWSSDGSMAAILLIDSTLLVWEVGR